jgi:hypothetical protein
VDSNLPAVPRRFFLFISVVRGVAIQQVDGANRVFEVICTRIGPKEWFCWTNCLHHCWHDVAVVLDSNTPLVKTVGFERHVDFMV